MLSIVPEIDEIVWTFIISFDKQFKRPSSRKRQSSKVCTLIFNEDNVEHLRVVEERSKVQTGNR